MKTHDLTTGPEFFGAIMDGRKMFEVRTDAREYEKGDLLRLREWDPMTGYTGREMTVRVTYIQRGWDWPKDLIVMSIAREDGGQAASMDTDALRRLAYEAGYLEGLVRLGIELMRESLRRLVRCRDAELNRRMRSWIEQAEAHMASDAKEDC